MTDDADVPDDGGSATTMATALEATSARAAEIVRDHVEFYEEVLPTVLLADIGRWNRTAPPSDPEGLDAARAVQALADLHEAGNESMRSIVATGFLESLPQPGEEGREVVERLPLALRRNFAAWRNGDRGDGRATRRSRLGRNLGRAVEHTSAWAALVPADRGRSLGRPDLIGG